MYVSRVQTKITVGELIDDNFKIFNELTNPTIDIM
jgi:hypothetical protein